MEVVQGGGPLVCAPRAPSSSSHPPLRLGHHRLDADGPASAALHVQTEEGGGGAGLDPSWWRISASGSWDGGERRMRYGKLIDDRPGSIPGAVQRRKLELLETHAPGASMRVVHSQSTASWRQDGSSGDLSSGSLSSSGTSRGLVSSSSSTRVTSFRQWSSNFSQTTSSNVAALKQEPRPAVTEFGNLELALNPIDVSFLRTRANVGRSGSIGSRRPPTRSRRLSSGAPSPESGESNATSPDARSPQSDFGSTGDVGESSDDRREKSPDIISNSSPVSESIRDSVSRLIALGWHPPGSGMPPLPPISPLRTAFRTSTPLHRKRSVSSEDLRSPDGNSGEGSNQDGDVDGDGVKWERGAAVRRSLPSSEWRSVVGPATDGGSRLLRPRDPLKSSSVPALGGPAAANRKSSLVTAESLMEMKGRLKHRGSVEDVPQQETNPHAMTNGVGSTGKDDLRLTEGPKVSLRAAKDDPIVQDDRRKSWSIGCRNIENREVDNVEEDTSASRRRSYAFEFSDEMKEIPSSPVKKDSDWLQMHNGGREEVGPRMMFKAISSDSGDFVQNRVNEMLKKWSALTGGSSEGDLNRRAASSSPIMRRQESRGSPASSSPIMRRQEGRGSPVSFSPIIRRQEGRGSPAKKSTTTWLDHGDAVRLENGGETERNEFVNPATTISGSRTTLRLNHAKGHSLFEKEANTGTSSSLEKVHSISEELPPSASGHLVEDYSCPRGLSPVDWCDGESNGILSIKEAPTKVDQGTTATSAGISVTFSNADGGDGHSNNNTRHHSVTHLESKELESTRADGLKIRASKKVEFSKTEVHFAAESGRFHIVETAGKPPPSNNFRRRRRSPTGTLNVDSSVAGARAAMLGGPSALTNGMRFGDSPYEKRLLAGTEGAAEISPTREEESGPIGDLSEDNQIATNGDSHYEYGFTSSRTFEEFEINEDKETKKPLGKIQDLDIPSSSVNFRNLALEDTSEKPRGILRGNPTTNNSFPWKSPLKLDDDSDDSSRPKFGGVRLRPVVSPELHSRINLCSLETSDTSHILSTEKALPSPLSPGQMELQKLLKSLRPVSAVPYVESGLDSSDELGTQVANGGGMEVRISSGIQSAVTNTVIIGEDSSEVLTPLSVAQRVREVEERRQRELKDKLSNNQRVATRTPGQFSTRVTLGPVSSSVMSMETQMLTKKLLPPVLASPPSPKLAAKISAQSKISRIQTSQDKVGPLQIVRKGIREETCRMKQRSEILAPPQEKAAPKAEAESTPSPFGRRFDARWRAPLSPLHLEIAPLQPLVTRRLSSSSTSSKVEDMWFKGLLTTAQPTHHQPPPSASWPSARGFGRVGDDRVMLKSPSLILQTMLSTAFPPKETKETNSRVSSATFTRREAVRTTAVEALRVEEVRSQKVEKASKETLMSGDKLQRNLSILRALYRDASEEECSDAYEAAGRLLGGLRGGGESRLGDGGSVVSGSWRRMKRAKQQQQQSSQRQTTESVPVPCPKPAPRKQAGKPRMKSVEPPRPPPRNHRNNAQARIRRSDAKGRAGGGRERVEERTRRRGGGGGVGVGGGDCGGKGDASGFAGDNVQHNQSDAKASAENRSRSEHCQDASGITCIALGPQAMTKGVRESKDDFATKEDSGTGPTSAEAGRCNKIFSALSVSRGDEATRRTNSKSEGVKLFTSTREKSPEDPVHSRLREYKSSSPSKDTSSAWQVGNPKASKEEAKTRSEHLMLKDSLKSSRKVKEVAASANESQKKSQYSVVSSPPPQTKIFSGLFGGSSAYEKSMKETELTDGMDGYSIKLKVIEKRSEEVGSQQKTSKSEHTQRRSSLDEKSKKVAGEASRSSGVGGTQVPRSPRLTEASRLSQLRQSSTATTTSSVRPASPRLSAAVGDPAGRSSPSTGRAVRKRVRRRASGGGPETPEDKRRGRKSSTGGEEVSEESAILAELTRAADEILNAVNGYSDDPTSDEDTGNAKGAAARSKRRATRAQHSKKSSSSSTTTTTTSKEIAKSSSTGVQKTGSTITRTRSGGKEHATAAAKERSPMKDGSSHEVASKGSVSAVRGNHGGSSSATAGSPSGSPNISSYARGTISSTSLSEKEKEKRLKLQQQGSGSPRTKSAMTRVEPTNRVAEVKLIEKRPPLPPGGQRKSKDGLKESRSEVHTRTTHGKTKTSTTSSNPLNGESEVTKSETKRSMNIARALEAVMPDPRNKTRKVEKKTDEHARKESPVLRPASPQLSPGISLSLERKKVASSREGDRTTRRGVHQSSNPPT